MRLVDGSASCAISGSPLPAGVRQILCGCCVPGDCTHNALIIFISNHSLSFFPIKRIKTYSGFQSHSVGYMFSATNQKHLFGLIHSIPFSFRFHPENTVMEFVLFSSASTRNFSTHHSCSLASLSRPHPGSASQKEIDQSFNQQSVLSCPFLQGRWEHVST